MYIYNIPLSCCTCCG